MRAGGRLQRVIFVRLLTHVTGRHRYVVAMYMDVALRAQACDHETKLRRRYAGGEFRTLYAPAIIDLITAAIHRRITLAILLITIMIIA